MTDRSKNPYSIKSVENALTVLEALSEIEGDVRISTLCEIVGMKKPYVFRILATFEQRGYIESGGTPGTYRLGLRAYEIGQRFLSRMGLLSKAKPVMEQLARQCDEAVYLAVRRKEDSLMLGMIDSTRMVNTAPLVGNSYPMPQTAVGKVLLAFDAEQNVRPRTKHSSGLGKELERIREKGAAIDFGGVGKDTASLAVPIFDEQRKVSGGLCIVGPDFRLGEERMATELLPRLKEAGQIVSSQLGYPVSHLG